MKRFPLVFFDEDKGDGKGGAGAGEIVTPPAPEVGEKVRTFASNKELNDFIVSKETKATEKILKELGITDVKSGKEGLEAFRKWQDEQKSEAERRDAQIKELTEGRTADQIRAEKAEAKAEALANGVPVERLDRVMKLALSGNYEGSTEEKIKAVIAEFPEFVKAPEGGSFGQQQKNAQLSATDTVLEKARKAAGLA